MPVKLKTKFPQCEHCIIGKHKRTPYKSSEAVSTGILDYVYADLWGPSKTESLERTRYFLSIMDDYSRKLWLYVLKTKDQAFSKFKMCCNQVETRTGKRVKCLRTDNGLEFASHEFNNFCSAKGITRHKTIPGHPQQNGIIERMNRTILERVRYLLSSSGFPKVFWGEAADTVAYLINRSPSVAKGFKTPQELWEYRKPDLTHLRVFGCIVFSHTSGDKLEPRALRCVMLGYPKGYKLWCYEPGFKRVIISWDVMFNETKMSFSTR